MGTVSSQQPVRRQTVVLVLAAAIAGFGCLLAGVLGYSHSSAAGRADPNAGLRQLDLLYLDEPAPRAAALGVVPGRVNLVVFCAGSCPVPAVPGAVLVRPTDPALASAYALDPSRGPGYAIVDARGRLRYRSYDPGLAQHGRELSILIAGVAR